MAGVDYKVISLNESENETRSTYQFIWATHGIDPTISRHRADVPFTLKCKNYKEFEFKVQVKFYSDNNHALWGQRLASINLECTAGKGTYSSSVDNIRFL